VSLGVAIKFCDAECKIKDQCTEPFF
jgi:hypothetical protein